MHTIPLPIPGTCVDLVGPLARTLEASPAFRRLYRISQFGLQISSPTNSLIRNHNRGMHCREVANLARRVVMMSTDSTEFANLVELAGLAHDIGHGPYSHTFDYFLQSIGSCSTHEQRSMSILTAVMATHMSREELWLVEALLVGTSLPSEFLAFTKFQNLLCAKTTREMDVDRMVYLVTDSFILGLPTTHLMEARERLIVSARNTHPDGYKWCDDEAAEQILVSQRTALFVNFYHSDAMKSLDGQILRHLNAMYTPDRWCALVENMTEFCCLGEDFIGVTSV